MQMNIFNLNMEFCLQVFDSTVVLYVGIKRRIPCGSVL